jgi:diguanylate cyclase (GGDEF)-like protein/PAS domain S-box-containing protein
MAPFGADYYKSLLDNLYDGIYCVDRNKTITYWNKAAGELTGYSEQEALGRISCVQVRVHPEEKDGTPGLDTCLLEQTLGDGQVREVECFILHREGRRIPVSTRVAPILGARGEVEGAIQIFRENSGRLAVRQTIGRLEALALLDQLTGLPNRRFLERFLDSKIDELHRYEVPFGVLFIDIDHFKDLNDHYGHDAGDRVLWSVSRQMTSILRTSDTIGRWGGEEFLAVILNVNRERLQQVGEKMRSYVERTAIQHESRQLQVTISLGGVMAGPPGRAEVDRNLLLRTADDLMYESKKAGRNRVTVGSIAEN